MAEFLPSRIQNFVDLRVFFHSLNSKHNSAVSVQNTEFCLVRILHPLSRERFENLMFFGNAISHEENILLG
jgi:hypothetical protein